MKILCYTMAAAGHINSVVGLAQVLQERGHQIYFVIEPDWKGKLVKFGFQELITILPNSDLPSEDTVEASEERAQRLKQNGLFSGLSPLEKHKFVAKGPVVTRMPGDVIAKEPQIRKMIEEIKPDLFLVDNFYLPPCIAYDKKAPWVLIWSANPCCLYASRKLPPYCSGLPINDQSEWEEFFAVDDELREAMGREQNKIFEQFGYPTVERYSSFAPRSPYLNIYGYPKELDYQEIAPLPERTLQIDAFNRYYAEKFELPGKLQAKIKSGCDRLIYISMGTLGSLDVEIMRKIVRSLADTPHLYIVSKGKLGHKYELPDNMWGDTYLPQTSILPLMHLVITHGGNNSTTETLAAGKPMIVMPLFADQYDNAQRIHETGLGIRIDPYSFESEQLVKAVEQLLNDSVAREKAEKAAQRIRESNSKEKACIAMEKLVKQHKSSLVNS